MIKLLSCCISHSCLHEFEIAIPKEALVLSSHALLEARAVPEVEDLVHWRQPCLKQKAERIYVC